MRYAVFFVLLAIVAIWLIQKAYHESEAEKAVEETTDYLTGKTPINIMLQKQIDIRKLEIQNAVRLFEGTNARAPRSLQELQEQGFISEEQKYIRYGNVKYEIISGQTPEGQFFIQGIGKDQKKGTNDDWIKVF